MDTPGFPKQRAVLLMRLPRRLSLLSKQAPEVQPPRPPAGRWQRRPCSWWLSSLLLALDSKSDHNQTERPLNSLSNANLNMPSIGKNKT